MKLLILVLGSIWLVGCGTLQQAGQQQAKWCVELDKEHNFNRCETNEVVCYGQTCLFKQQPPAPAAAEPAKGAKK